MMSTFLFLGCDNIIVEKLNNLCAEHFADKTLLLLEPLDVLEEWIKEQFANATHGLGNYTSDWFIEP